MTKLTLNVTCEAFDRGVLADLLRAAADGFDKEIDDGSIRYTDGDQVGWSVDRDNVDV